MKAFTPFGHNQGQPVAPIDTSEDNLKEKNTASTDNIAPQQSNVRRTFNFNPAPQNNNAPVRNTAPIKNGFQHTPAAAQNNHQTTSTVSQPIQNSSTKDMLSVEEKRKRALAILSGNTNVPQQATSFKAPAQLGPVDDKIVASSVEPKVANDTPIKKSFTFGAPNKNQDNSQYKELSGFVLEDAIGFVDTAPNSNTKSQPHTPTEVPVFEAERHNPQNNNGDQKRLEFLALKEKVKDIRIKEIAQTIGASNNEDKIRNKWKMPWGDNVSIQGQQWYNHNAVSKFRGGRDAISFAKYIMSHEFRYDLDDKIQARKAENRGVYWLGETFGEQIDKSDIIAAKENLEYDFKKPYSVPTRFEDQYLDKVRNYIIQERQVPAWVVEKQIAAGKLYAGIPNQYLNKTTFDNFGKRNLVKRDLHNLSDSEIYCVFRSGDEKMGAAECRCITEPWGDNFQKGFSEGSYKKLFGFMVIGEAGLEKKEVSLVEAAIDAMSYQAIHHWAHVISTGGTDNSEFVLKISREVLENPTYNLVFGFDNDKAGDNFAEAILEQLKKEFTPEVIQAHLDSGKIARKRTPVGKDWNDYLKTIPVEDLYQPSTTPSTHEDAVVKKVRTKKENIVEDQKTEALKTTDTSMDTIATSSTSIPQEEIPIVPAAIAPTVAREEEVKSFEQTKTAKEEAIQLTPTKTGAPAEAPVQQPALSQNKPTFTFNFKKPTVKSATEVVSPDNVRKFKF